ncbi:MAG: tyrosine-protein phosphatase [Coriobacteriales bacterium]|nr:tyrosine-protein phosphatase [Coriobacteriales bacterium]
MRFDELPCFVEGFDPGMNLRDLGGWPTCDGRRVRRGFIYRSARLCELDTSELVRFQQLGLACVVDLRPSEEALRYPDPKLPSFVYVRADAGRDPLSEEDLAHLSPAEVIEASARKTAAMAFGNAGIKRVLELIEQGRAPLLFHCNSGRDRSGVCAMVVLMALGCSDDVLMADYLLTNAYRFAALNYLREAYAPALQLGKDYEDLITLMGGVLQQVGQAVLKAIDDRYPTREAYLEAEYGLDGERLVSLRNQYLE